MKNLLLAIIALGITSGYASEQDGGSVVSLVGDAMNTTANQALKVGSIVSPGDRITTGENAQLRILLGSDIAIQLGPKSEFTVQHDRLKPWYLKLTAGQVLATVRKAVKQAVGSPAKFEVQSGGSVMGVRGTDFFVKRAPGDSTFFCACNGTINVSLASGKSKKTVTGVHHNQPQYFADRSGNSRPMPKGENPGHTDTEISELQALLK